MRLPYALTRGCLEYWQKRYDDALMRDPCRLHALLLDLLLFKVVLKRDPCRLHALLLDLLLFKVV
jgi:hypothetical protein